MAVTQERTKSKDNDICSSHPGIDFLICVIEAISHSMWHKSKKKLCKLIEQQDLFHIVKFNSFGWKDAKAIICLYNQAKGTLFTHNIVFIII